MSTKQNNPTMNQPRLLITLCTYNERENLELLIPEIHSHAEDADILVIDDGSPDGTGGLADEMAKDDPRIHVKHRAGKLGLGSAILEGFRFSIEHDYDFLINLDADFSHAPRYIPAMREKTNEVDVVIGSRYVTGGDVEGWGFKRYLMSSGINGYARLFLGLKTKDNSGSYRCYRVAKLNQLDFNLFRAHGYAFQEEILYRLKKVGCLFCEVPIVFEDRRYGSSKIDWKEAVSALWIIFRLGIDRLLRKRVSKKE